MKLISCKSYEELSCKAADYIGAQIISKPDCMLGLATGTTPIGLYTELANRCNEGVLDFSQVRTVNLDEYRSLDGTNEQSYRYFMNKYLFSKVNINLDNTRVPDGLTKNCEQTGEEYDEYIAFQGGIDLQLLGIGNNGHIGFNEPDTAFTAPTHCVNLTENTIQANSRLFNSSDEVPRQAMTMGMRSIMQAKKILMIANGAGKREILHKAIFGPITPQVPASIIQLHPDVVVIADFKIE